MSGTISEDDIDGFLRALRAGDVDKKINLLQLWGIKLEEAAELPQRTIDPITMLVAPFLRASSHLLVTSALSSFLPVFMPLVPATSSETHIRLAVTQLLPGLVDKLNDPKDKIAEPAKDLIVLLGRKAYAADAEFPHTSTVSPKGKDTGGVAAIWETAIKDVLAGRLARGKIGALRLLLTIREDKSCKLPLKPWLPSLVNLLEDSDGGVRDQARETVVALLAPPAPPAARSELKKLMLQRNVRKSIADTILSRVLGGAVASTPAASAAESAAPPEVVPRSGATTPAEDIPVVYIASARDLENEFKAMLPHFSGRETEHNWGPRERALLRIRGMLRGNVFAQLPDALLAGLKSGILDDVGKTLLSLRTTVAQHACALVQELADSLGSSFDQFVETLLPTLGKMAGFTKRIIADKSQRAVTAMIKHTTAYRVLLAHIVATAQEKNVQTRQFGATHLKVFLDNIAKHLPVIESTHGAIDQVQSTIKKLLSDVNPQVREQARAAFWGFDKLWPKKSAALMESLDSTARKQLEKASGSGLASAPATPVRAAPPKARASAAILAAKRARAAELAAERAAAEQNNQAPSDPAPDSALDNTPEPVTPAGLARLRREPVEPMSPSPALPRALGHNVEALVPSTPPALVASPVGDSETAVHAAQTPSPAKNIASPARSIPRPVASSRTSTDPSALRRVSGGSLPRPIVPPASGAVKSIPSSNTSSRSRSPSLSRTLSRSPPSLMESMHQPFRTPGSVGPSAASSDTSKLRTPVQQRFSASKSSRGQELLVTTSPADSHQMASPPAAHTNYFSEPPLDAADEARRAQVAQGLSAAQQLIDFDDDLPTTSQQPITPARPSRLAQNTPLNRFQTPRNASGNRVRQVWEDSPRALTPKVLKRIEGRNTERNWWAQRRDRLEQVNTKDPVQVSSIEQDVTALAAGQPDISNLQRLTALSKQHQITLPGQPEEDNIAKERLIWVNDRLFDRILQSLVTFLDPAQSQELLECSLVLLWEMVKNQWVMFETQEDAMLDALFRLRGLNNSVILGSTTALISLLTEVSDPAFMMSLLRSALDRYLEANPPQSERGSASGTGGAVRAVGYSFALNAMGMCILHLPPEAVELEAQRIQNHVFVAIDNKSIIHARQAAYGVILAVQCVLSDDVRTLSLFPKLESGHRSFVTYLMRERGLLGPTQTEADAAARREAVLGDLVEGLSKRVQRT